MATLPSSFAMSKTLSHRAAFLVTQTPPEITNDDSIPFRRTWKSSEATLNPKQPSDEFQDRMRQRLSHVLQDKTNKVNLHILSEMTDFSKASLSLWRRDLYRGNTLAIAESVQKVLEELAKTDYVYLPEIHRGICSNANRNRRRFSDSMCVDVDQTEVQDQDDSDKDEPSHGRSALANSGPHGHGEGAKGVMLSSFLNSCQSKRRRSDGMGAEISSSSQFRTSSPSTVAGKGMSSSLGGFTLPGYSLSGGALSSVFPSNGPSPVSLAPPPSSYLSHPPKPPGNMRSIPESTNGHQGNNGANGNGSPTGINPRYSLTSRSSSSSSLPPRAIDQLRMLSMQPPTTHSNRLVSPTSNGAKAAAPSGLRRHSATPTSISTAAHHAMATVHTPITQNSFNPNGSNNNSNSNGHLHNSGGGGGGGGHHMSMSMLTHDNFSNSSSSSLPSFAQFCAQPRLARSADELLVENAVGRHHLPNGMPEDSRMIPEEDQQAAMSRVLGMFSKGATFQK